MTGTVLVLGEFGDRGSLGHGGGVPVVSRVVNDLESRRGQVLDHFVDESWPVGAVEVVDGLGDGRLVQKRLVSFGERFSGGCADQQVFVIPAGVVGCRGQRADTDGGCTGVWGR